MRVFAKRVSGFDPSAAPVLKFEAERCRDAFIGEAKRGDLVVCVGATGASRGRLLGLVEVWPSLPLAHGDLAWPKPTVGSIDAIPVRRAWTFDPQLLLFDLLQERLIFESDDRAIRLQELDAAAVLAVPRVEIPITAGLATYLKSDGPRFGPTTGLPPQLWAGVVSREVNGCAWTYLMRFGSRDLWKVGYSQDVHERLSQLNEHVPFEELGECWSIFLRRRWSSTLEAYEMEQRVLRALTPFRSTGERVRCPEETVVHEWNCASSSSSASAEITAFDVDPNT